MICMRLSSRGAAHVVVASSAKWEIRVGMTRGEQWLSLEWLRDGKKKQIPPARFALQENNAATSLQDLIWTGVKAIGTFLVCSRYPTHGVVLVQDSTNRTGRPIIFRGSVQHI